MMLCRIQATSKVHLLLFGWDSSFHRATGCRSNDWVWGLQRRQLFLFGLSSI